MGPDLAFAHSLADDADALTLGRFRARDLRVATKPDMTPVSEADTAVEQAIRARVAAERPGESVFGEELGDDGGPVRWIVDPIDATRNYVRGIPVFATLIALEREGELVLGVVSAPALRRRWWAERGGGAFADGDPIHVSGVRRVEDAVFAYTSHRSFGEVGAEAAFERLAGRAWVARGYGDFWQYMLIAEGAADMSAETGVGLWDLAAPLVIVEEAGGRFTDWRGERRADGGNSIASNGHLHDEALAAFNG